MKMEPKFEKANEIYFRLGIIYKQQQKYDLSLQVTCLLTLQRKCDILVLIIDPIIQCFRYILHSPPRPLTEIDIWFQTGHVYEQQKEVRTHVVVFWGLAQRTSSRFIDNNNTYFFIMIIIPHSTNPLKTHMNEFWLKIQSMPKFYSNWAGYIINKTRRSPTKPWPFSI